MPTITTALQAKADRLIADRKVEHVRGLVYRVQGDHDVYIVHLGYPEDVSGACNCPSQADVCSHILAACIEWKTERELALELILRHIKPKFDPFEGLE